MSAPNTHDAEKRSLLLAVRIFTEFGAAIAVPAVVAAVLGSKLDAARQTAPRYLVVFLVIAFVLTAAYVRRRATSYGKEYEGIVRKG